MSNQTPPAPQQWALAATAILTTLTRRTPRHDCLGGAPQGPDSQATAKAILLNSWGIDARPKLESTLEWLSTGGHSTDYQKVAAAFAQAPPQQRQGDPKMAFVGQYGAQLGNRGLLAWDLGRLLAVAGWGYLAGFCSDVEAWGLILPAAERLRSTYTSWDEYGQHYRLGCLFWSADAVGQIDQVLAQLRSAPDSPWRVVPWRLEGAANVGAAPYAAPPGAGAYGGVPAVAPPPGGAPAGAYGAAPPGASPYGAAPPGAAPGASPYGAAPGASPYGAAAPGASPYGAAAPGASPYGAAAPGASPYGAAPAVGAYGGVPVVAPPPGGAAPPGAYGGAPVVGSYGGVPVIAPPPGGGAPYGASPYGGAPGMAPYGGAPIINPSPGGGGMPGMPGGMPGVPGKKKTMLIVGLALGGLVAFCVVGGVAWHFTHESHEHEHHKH
jgi:hypothetical protein